MKKNITHFLFLSFFVMIGFTAMAQPVPKFTEVHNAQAIDWVAAMKYLGIPYGPSVTLNSNRTTQPALFYQTTGDIGLFLYDLNTATWVKISTSGTVPDLQTVTTAGNTTDQYMEILLGANMRLSGTDGSDIGAFAFRNIADNTLGRIRHINDGNNYDWIMPTQSGTVALTTDIPAGYALNLVTGATGTASPNHGANAINWQWNTLAGATALKLSSTSTAASGGLQKVFEVSLSGANANSSQSTYGIDVSNTHTGTTASNFGIRSTVGAATLSVAGIFQAVSTSSGQNTAVSATATNGSINNAIYTSQGDVRLNQVGGETYFGYAGSVSGIYNVGGSTSGTITFQPQAAAGTYNWNWPTTAGTAGYVLTSQGGGSTAMTWTDISGLSSLTDGSGTTAVGSAVDWRGTLTTVASIDLDGNDVHFYDANNYGDGFFQVSTTNGIVNIGDWQGNVNSTFISVDDANSRNTLFASQTDIYNPSLIIGSDATSDMHYRTSSGKLGRIPIGTAGKYLMSNGAGSAPSWETGQVALSSVTAPTTSATSSANGNLQIQFAWNSLTSGTAFHINSNGTAAASNTQTAFKASSSGANSNSTQTTYAGYFTNTHTGTASSNVAAYFTASGGTNNYSVFTGEGDVALNQVGGVTKIGLAGSVNGTIKMDGSTSGTVTIQPQSAAGTYNFNLPTTAGTSGDVLTSAGGGSSAMTWTTPVTASSTTTFTNKRWTARVGSTTSSATPTINTDNVDIYKLTAQAADITSMTTNLSGTPNDGDVLEIQITDNGTARAITWGSSFASSTVTLPTTTVISTTLTVILQYYTTSSYGNNKWICVNYY